MSANFHDLIHGFHRFKESYFMKEREFLTRSRTARVPRLWSLPAVIRARIPRF